MDFKADRSAQKDLDGMKIRDKVIVKRPGEKAISIVKPGVNKNVQVMQGNEAAEPFRGFAEACSGYLNLFFIP